MVGTTVGLVSTVRFPSDKDSDSKDRSWNILSSWAAYHISKGFYLFVCFDADDGSNDNLCEALQHHFPSSNLSVQYRNQLRIQCQEHCTLWKSLGMIYDTDLQARQQCHAELALFLASRAGLRWLLHIDVDELFWTHEDSIEPHFRWLEEHWGALQMTYANHEGVPERERSTPEWEESEVCGDPFIDITLFRRNHMTLPLDGEHGRCMMRWRNRTSHGQYFVAYDNGKSAVRVPKNHDKSGLTHVAVPASVHKFHIKEASVSPHSVKEGRSGRCFTALADPRHLDVDGVIPCALPVILHCKEVGWCLSYDLDICMSF
eukprot:242155_1